MGVVLPGVDVVRVTVVRGHRRVDVSVAVGVPVAELLPDLARTLRADGEVHTLASVLGAPLDPALGLGPQRVRDGQVLTLLTGGEGEDHRHDDLAAVVRDVGAAELSRWRPAHLHTVVWIVLVAVGVLAALLVPAATRAVAVGVGLLYVAGATALLAFTVRSGAADPRLWAVGGVAAWHVALLGVETTAGAPGVSEGLGPAPGVTAAGAALVLWGIALLLTLPRLREWSAVPLAAGVGFVVAGTVAAVTGAEPAVVLWAIASLSLVLQRWVPLALVDAFLVPDAPRVPEPTQVGRDLAAVHRLSTGVALVVAVGCVVVSPSAVAAGAWGQAWVIAVCLTFLLRVRHQSLRDHVVVAVGGATAVAGAGAWAAGRAGAADAALVGCAVVGLLTPVFWAPAAVRPSGVRWGWWGDQVERAAVALLVPLFLLGAGLVPSPAGWFT